MKAWKVFKSSLPMYLCLSEKSFFMQKSNIIIAKSGVDNYTCNFAVIENNDSKVQKEIIKEYFNQDGLIFAPEECKNSINSWASELGFKHLGKFPVMNKVQDPSKVFLKHYDNVRVERVLDGKSLQDFLNVFSETRKISFEDASSMFPQPLSTSIYFLYIAYYLDEPAGIFIAIDTKDGGFIADVDVKEHLRNSNVLGILAEKVAYDATNNQILDYSTVIASKFSYSVVMKHGYAIEKYCDLWRKGEAKINGNS